ncbi:hypothetical protein [Paenibacillus amylolyticus]|uniref:DNA mismatch repair protein, MutS n=1 Tax=Paenibacillus amylolyticus TaxID=1451 RepID=A0A100VM61_PAEAM|nr:hypothetical protein [Paenibacillus amylolyticus]GAS82420.1 DNA mismatch repair protein, MutS [Paenibacillus amylolyticus]
MSNRVAGLINEWEGVAPEDLIEAIKERDQAMKEMTEINASIAAERDETKRLLEWFQNRCLEFMNEKAKWETQEGTA